MFLLFCIFYKEHVVFLESQNIIIQNERIIGGISTGGEGGTADLENSIGQKQRNIDLSVEER